MFASGSSVYEPNVLKQSGAVVGVGVGVGVGVEPTNNA